jgi:hypothetical protein
VSDFSPFFFVQACITNWHLSAFDDGSMNDCSDEAHAAVRIESRNKVELTRRPIGEKKQFTPIKILCAGFPGDFQIVTAIITH